MKLRRRRAAEQNRSLKDVINQALRIGLGAGRPARKRYRFRPPVMNGRLLPGVDQNDRDSLFDLPEGR